jgi:hypothetical protein
VRRLGGMLARVRGHIILRDLDRASPLAIPILLEIGRESVYGEAVDTLLDEAATELIEEAIEGVPQCAIVAWLKRCTRYLSERGQYFRTKLAPYDHSVTINTQKVPLRRRRYKLTFFMRRF